MSATRSPRKQKVLQQDDKKTDSSPSKRTLTPSPEKSKHFKESLLSPASLKKVGIGSPPKKKPKLWKSKWQLATLSGGVTETGRKKRATEASRLLDDEGVIHMLNRVPSVYGEVPIAAGSSNPPRLHRARTAATKPKPVKEKKPKQTKVEKMRIKEEPEPDIFIPTRIGKHIQRSPNPLKQDIKRESDSVLLSPRRASRNLTGLLTTTGLTDNVNLPPQIDDSFISLRELPSDLLDSVMNCDIRYCLPSQGLPVDPARTAASHTTSRPATAVGRNPSQSQHNYPSTKPNPTSSQTKQGKSNQFHHQQQPPPQFHQPPSHRPSTVTVVVAAPSAAALLVDRKLSPPPSFTAASSLADSTTSLATDQWSRVSGGNSSYTNVAAAPRPRSRTEPESTIVSAAAAESRLEAVRLCMSGERLAATVSATSKSPGAFSEIYVRLYESFAQVTIAPAKTKLTASLGPSTMDEIVRLLNFVASTKMYKAVLLTGIGNVFCQGVDLMHLLEDNAEKRKEVANRLASAVERLVLAISGFPKVLVAAVNGTTTGLGLSLLPLCDIVYASEKAHFNFYSARLGQIPEGGASISLSGNRQTASIKEMLLFGRSLTSSEMMEAGLVSQVFLSGRLMEEAIPRVRSHCATASSGLHYNKILLSQSLNAQLTSLLPAETAMLANMWASNEFHKNLVSFMAQNQCSLQLQKPS